ncbi:hypothetical protein C2845_PM04G15880 [Panicum miliaceum]|uniref:Uncharacterized protein n=1 Tax=Panicum miliaceum TaxID=4540 RepID=A0A3L6QTX9_PANMI|nr:hypothetical protein C2845_PM04G15880 [Panicum miliaceum]
MSGAAAPALRPVVSAKPDSVVRRDGGGSRRSPWRGTTLPWCQVNPASSKPNPGPGHRDNCGTVVLDGKRKDYNSRNMADEEPSKEEEDGAEEKESTKPRNDESENESP